ncbi:hypothetical protein A4G19_03775 [Pasteurellaceae bacterium Macca]|nr:hypothetical protein [Pasteurellaceae bacterium Macca]
MAGWTMPVQRASYRGVRFEVISVDDRFERAVVEHAYPFVNGADLEDMGLEVQEVSFQAVLYGKGYYTDYKKLLDALQKQGADVLVHPVRGRMPNMICTSVNLRHEAEYVNYVTLDLTFREATPSKPIFVFESALVSRIDALLNQLDDLIDEAMGWWASAMEAIAFVENVKSRLLGVWGAISGCLAQLSGLFAVNQAPSFSPVGGVSPTTFASRSRALLGQASGLIRREFRKMENLSFATEQARFNEVLRLVKQINQLPVDLASGKSRLVRNSSRYANAIRQQKGAERWHSRASLIQPQDTAELACLLQLCTSTLLAEVATRIIEAKQDTLLPVEIDEMNRQVRLQFMEALNTLRALQQAKEQENQAHALNNTPPNLTSYTQSQQLAEHIRQVAGLFNQLAIAAINRKPPLIVREAPLEGAIHQIAHAFYGDFRRAPELLALNPHLIYPYHIEQGVLLNSYAK